MSQETGAKPASDTKRNYQPRCQQCRGCTAADCGECINCKAKTKFGGPGGPYRYCIKRKCEAQARKKIPMTSGAARLHHGAVASECVAGESGDDELPIINLTLDDENGIENEAPMPAELQRNPSLMAASLVDPATEAKDRPEENEAGESGDDQLPSVELILTDEEESEDRTLGILQRNPSLMSGTPATEAEVGPEEDRTGSNIAELLQPLIQKMERGDVKVTELQDELKVKENDLSQLRQTETEMFLQFAQQTAKLQKQEEKISQLQTTAQQREQELQEEVAHLRKASKQSEQRLKEKDDEVSQIRSTALQKAIEVQEQLNSAVRVQRAQQQQNQDFAHLRERANRSAQVQTAFDQQVKTLTEKQQKISQLEETVKKHEELEQQREQLSRQQAMMLLQKELKISQLEEATLQQYQRMQQLEADGKRQMQKVREKELEIAGLREQTNRSAQHVKVVEQQLKTLQEQERKMKEWLASIPMHGV